MAVQIVKQLECTVPGTVHSLRLDTFTTHLRVDIILSRDRLGGSGSGVGSAGDDAGRRAHPEEAKRPGRRCLSTAATAAQLSRAPRQPPPTGQQTQRPQQPSKAPKAPSALQQPAPAATPERPAAAQLSTPVQGVPHDEATTEPAQVGPPFCHVQPSSRGRLHRVPSTEVGKIVHAIRDGVRAVALER